MICLTLLLRLTPTGRTKLRYTCTVSAALLCWTTWFDTSPGIVHVEESCEAMLSKVARNVRAHHTASNHTQYTDLFLSIRTSKAYHDMRGGVSDRILQTMRQRIRVLLASQIVPPHVVWSGSAGQRTTARPAGVLVNNEGAVPLLEPLPRQVLTDTMQHCSPSISDAAPQMSWWMSTFSTWRQTYQTTQGLDVPMDAYVGQEEGLCHRINHTILFQST